MRLIYHPDAETELVEAAQFYEHRVPGLGGHFLDAVNHAVELIIHDPERWNVIEGDVRRYLISRFPYSIYYRSLTEAIRILALKHHSRHPDYWRYRISQ